MSGIAGIAGREDPAAVNAVASMVAGAAHRGPDDQGVKPLAGAILGHTRLSIIDLNTGHQPLGTPDGRYWITFNGEIYNYRELRAELQAAGYGFQTHSDTEALIAAYSQWGTEAFARLNGMYACVIWDSQERRLLALRERLYREKPFHYSLLADGSLLFASETKALRASGLLALHVELARVDSYLALGYVPPDRSIFQEVNILPAGSYLTWHMGRAETSSYWQPTFIANESIAENEAIEELRRRVDLAVARRLVADVSVGALLSGGLDSTTVVTSMAAHSSGPVKTFSVGFGNLINELPAAGALAGKLRTDHHEIQVDLQVGELLTQMAGIYDEPLSDPLSIPTYVVSRFAAENIKVVLTGCGGDELFAGHDGWYRPLVASEHMPKGDLAYATLRLATRLTAIGARLGLPVKDTLQNLWERRQLTDMRRAYPDSMGAAPRKCDALSGQTPGGDLEKEYRDIVRIPPAPRCSSRVIGMNRAFWST